MTKVSITVTDRGPKIVDGPMFKLMVPDRKVWNQIVTGFGSEKEAARHIFVLEGVLHDTKPEEPKKGVAFCNIRHADDCKTCRIDRIEKENKSLLFQKARRPKALIWACENFAHMFEFTNDLLRYGTPDFYALRHEGWGEKILKLEDKILEFLGRQMRQRRANRLDKTWNTFDGFFENPLERYVKEGGWKLWRFVESITTRYKCVKKYEGVRGWNILATLPVHGSFIERMERAMYLIPKDEVLDELYDMIRKFNDQINRIREDRYWDRENAFQIAAKIIGGNYLRNKKVLDIPNEPYFKVEEKDGELIFTRVIAEEKMIGPRGFFSHKGYGHADFDWVTYFHETEEDGKELPEFCHLFAETYEAIKDIASEEEQRRVHDLIRGLNNCIKSAKKRIRMRILRLWDEAV